jgi:hypothetical protein
MQTHRTRDLLVCSAVPQPLRYQVSLLVLYRTEEFAGDSWEVRKHSANCKKLGQ